MSLRLPLPACLFVLTAPLLAGCSQAISPTVIADAQLVARVKTALINDPALGVRALEVRATAGVVRLTGRVESDAEAQRAVDLVRTVPGVAAVRSELLVENTPSDRSGQTSASPPVPDAQSSGIPDLEEAARERNLVALGVSIGITNPRSRDLGSTLRISPLLRLGRGSGLGLTVGFGWFDSDFALTEGQIPGDLGRVRVKPVMAGLGYTARRDRVLTSVSLVGGIAFNSLSDRDRSVGPVWALDVDNSFAWRPGGSVWLELGPRAAFNVFAGYLVTRPRITVIEDGKTRNRGLRADTAMLHAGLAYKLF